MKNTSKKLISAAAALIVATGSVSGAVPVLFPVTVYAGEQLGQNDFDSGVGLPWHICESAAGEMEFDISGGVYRITIVNPGGASRGGEDRWDCQFRHRGLRIVAGHQYRVQYEITPSNSGKYYTKIGNLEGNVEVWHNMSNGYDLDGTWDPIYIGANETKKVDLTFTAGSSVDVAEWAFHLGGDGQYTQGDCFPAGTVITFDNMSLTDLTSDENDYVAPPVWERADILTNQVGYLTGRKKQATMVCDDKKAVAFDVVDESGNTVYSGDSMPFGKDADSGDNVHIIDFTDLADSGKYHIEAANGAKSRTFSIGGTSEYSRLIYDSLNYFYQNRSGIPIESRFISSGDKDRLSRAAGHVTDNAEIQHTWGYSGTSGTVDVTGGWYDAGDHGKYVVNGGLSLWLLQNQYETAKIYGFDSAYADGTMYIPENNNGFPDLLDEARYEGEWMFRMVIDGGEYDGMAYHKAHDETWTGLGVVPADDDKKRIIKPPTTAATLNFAACAAQSARLWAGLDNAYSQKCINAAVKSYEAAKEHPSMFAPMDESIGGGAYGDDDVTDEFYWAACELFITTGDEKYFKDMKSSKFFLKVPTDMTGGESVDSAGSFDWGNTAALGSLSLCLSSGSLDSSDQNKLYNDLIKAAETYLDIASKQGYGVPYRSSTIAYNDKDHGYQWGSNALVAGNSMILSYGYLMSGEEKYLDGAVSGMDYLLGRNPNDISYVTGYGDHTTENPHHRFWAHQIYDNFPSAPDGVLAGGPNSGMQDPWVRGSGWKKGQIPPQKCYLDHIEAWCVNECTINWNAVLSWLTAFTAVENGGIAVGADVPKGEELSYAASYDDTDEYDDDGDVYEEGSADSSSDDDSGYVKPDSESEKEQTVKPSKKGADRTDTDKKDDNEDEKDSKNRIIVVAIIAGAALLALISIEVFILRIMKMKNNK
ncbi:MAG: glycoside hydrolase family 9 protein [Oscillospiraceae bacterium]|nr:glycoside hydrolase family 9 protein [Oscillospiraceae bacterium]